jgi:hypothetical protein
MEVAAIVVNVTIVIQANATAFLPNALVQVHARWRDANQEVGNGRVGRLRAELQRPAGGGGGLRVCTRWAMCSMYVARCIQAWQSG